MKIFLLWFALAAAVAAEPFKTVGDVWKAGLANLPGGSGMSSSLCVLDEQGQTVLEWDSQRLLVPASTLKLATATGILQQGGQTQQLVTRLQMVGQRVRLVGDYDPELTSGDIENLALELIPKLKGPILLEVTPPDPEPYPLGWSWDDLSSSFAPPLSALVFDHGLVPLKLTAATQLQVKGPPWAPSTGLGFLPRMGEFEMLVLPGWENWVMAGQLTPGTEEAVTVPMVRPELAAARLLTEVFKRNGVAVEVSGPPGNFGQGGTAIEVSHRSRAVQQMLVQGLAESDNLVLECLYRRFRRPLPGAWAGQTLRVVDGCGLSRYNLVSTRQLVQLFQSEPALVDYLPRAGVDGTMKRRAAEGQLRAKTGTMSGVSGLVGEFTGVSGKRYRFALLLNGFVGPAAPFKKAEDDLVGLLVKNL
ncbi:MAG: D-alanyl-D-alanine carboxypeptidase/D-alanyl-D-alanine-endopeptidase [Candidatus Eremiobacteraeota bacterium]|nr:D-alanyl-D-alanine carboxypeptidase/D-alanyl-D-alanine-endopeptidase [Candidatus Eremiobacteraeota bacterium]MCW5870691.1 D-alanyl-D-alanine carboxypeptidase/D-alanyl-D-alanine-endopeptidase [Candidatus Eremiobacteraeota bacterium]